MFKKDVYNLTNPQKNIWQLEQVNSNNNSINHNLTIMKLKGTLDKNLLVETINKVIEVNDSFRIKFVKKENSLYQYIEDYSHVNIEDKYINTNDISDIIKYYKGLEINLDKLYSFCLVFTPDYTYILYKSHHIISDAWGMTQVAEQIKEIYKKLLNKNNIEDYKKISYTSLIERERNYFNSNKYSLDKQFWEKYVTSLSYSKLFNNVDIFDKKANRFEQIIDNSLFDQISDYCTENKITEYSFFLGILAIYFNKIFNLENMVIGTPFLNRQKRLNELECTGMYVSTLPLEINVNIEDTFVSLCQNISSTNLSLFRHSNFPYHDIQQMYYEKTKNNSNLYELGFSYQINNLKTNISDEDLGECYWIFSGKQNNPLTIHITTLNNYKLINYDYLLSCFTENEIKKMNDIILHLISEVISGKGNLSNINVLTNYDVSLLTKFNNTGDIDLSDKTVVDIFNDIVRSYQNDTAIYYNDIEVTYKQLDNKINTIAKVLVDLGVTKNIPVALFFDKSIEMIASMFAILKVGGYYIPILPDENQDRIEYILNDCSPKCVLTHKDYDIKIPTNSLIVNLDKVDFNKSYNIDFPNIDPEDIAYMIYTSGSTGKPKGTMVMHRNICTLKTSIENDSILKATDKDVSMSLLKYSFDASGIDIYTALLFGGKLVLVSKEDELNPEKVINIIEKRQVTRSFLIPKWIEHISLQEKLHDANLSSLRILGTGGETLKPYIIENLISKYSDLKVLNLYGPTETTMFTTCKDVSVYEIKNNYTSIGRPIYGSRIGIINKNLELMPINIKGELIVYEDLNSIKNIAKGYLNLPEQTQNKFVEFYHPILQKNVRAYKTGDMAKINDSLEIEFIGRNDDVVKVNGGYLVALNEVENKIQKLLGTNFKVFTIAIPYKNTKSIIVFINKNEDNISLNNIKNYINRNISFYMKPKKIIELEEFPRNSSGKINRKELENIAINYMQETNNKFIAPKTKTEIDVCNYLKKLLEIDEISVTDDFLDDLGLDSLSLTSLYTYLEKYNIAIQDIYNNSNVKDLANLIDNNHSNQMEPDLSNVSNIKILNNVKHFDLSTVLITGVTGFLGIHLLKDLLLNKHVNTIYCIIRNKINLSGKKRLLKMMDYYFNSDINLLNLVEKKIIILNGDISKTQLGLSKQSYLELKEKITVVINSAANVRHFVKPNQIRKDNVQSVNNLIEFCGEKISLAHISTLSIAGFNGDLTENKIFDENTLFMNQDFNNNPYLISKFEAEKNILKATNEINLNAVIFRLGNIMPRYSDGLFQMNANQNVFLSSLKAIIDSKVIAKEFLGLKLEFSPVDECSKFVINLLQNNGTNSIYHILSDKEVTISELRTLLEFLKCDILDVDLKTFIEELSKNSDEYTKEYILNNNLNRYSQDITLNKLSSLNLEWQSIDINYIQKILNIIKKLK